MSTHLSRPARALALGVVALGGSLVLVVAGPLDPPPGPPVSTMKTLDEIEPRIAVNTLPGDATSTHVISQSGSYYLTARIVGEIDKSGILILADDVTLDLNGFSLQGVAGSIDGITVGTLVLPVNNLRVHNGVIRDWGRRGIDGDLANNCLIEDVRAFRNGETGIRAGAGVSPPMGPVVRNCVSQGNALNGFQIENGVIESCVAADNLARGINALGATVQNCVGTNNDTDGIGGSGVVLNSVAVANGIDGIHFSGTITGCRVSNNSNDGIDATAGSIVKDNRASFNGADGIRAGDGCQITGNSAHDNTAGVELASACVARDNLCNQNTQSGILAQGTSNRIDSNTLTNNNKGIELMLGGNLVIRNSASFNALGYDDPGSNTIGPIITATGIIASEHPWANFDF